MDVGSPILMPRDRPAWRETCGPPACRRRGLRAYHCRSKAGNRVATELAGSQRAKQRHTIRIKAMRIPLFHVNAFTTQPSRGNPAAVCFLDSWLDDELLRKVAAENNLSETAFFVTKGDQHEAIHYELRWFTPRGEVKLCGHATLASGYVVLTLLQLELDTVQFETRQSGTLTVRKEGELLSMDFPAIFLKPCLSPPESLVPALGPPPRRILEGNETYIAIYDHESAIQNMRPDFARLEQLHPFAVAVTAPGDHVDFVSRYFKPSYGMPEDPVTGSLHCALTPYWAARLNKSKLHARQLSERGGELWCEPKGDRVLLNGHALLTLQGSLQI
jgi:PhzF family phenazine biosynthesis protein